MDVTRPLPEMIKLYDPKGKVLEKLVHYDWKPLYYQKCCQLVHIYKDQRKQKQDGMIQKTGEGMQKQEWRKVTVLEPQSNPEVEPQWQVARGKSATKKHADVIREKEVDIGNAFKALVDTAQKIVQLSEAQGEKEKQNKKVLNNWKWVDNYDEAPGGRLWVIWDSTQLDYTLIRTHEQFILGKPVQEVETRDFKQFLLDAKVDELKTVGRQYTWTNNHVHSRIDRILVNAEWIQKCLNMEGMSMNPGFSDRCPLSVSFDTSSQAVQLNWRPRNGRHTMLTVWSKLKKLKVALKQMNKEESSGIDNKIQDARGRLENFQSRMSIRGQDVEQVELERATKLELEKWLMNPDELEAEILSFYWGLLSTAATQLLAINSKIMQNGSMLSRSQQLQLIRPVSREEVKQALMGIDDNKAPGCDEYNSYFFKKTWHILEKEVTTTIQEFFESADMCKAINCTTITLIPKVQNPKNIRDFRPIYCCTILYKLISKVITTRMQGVMEDLVDNCQAAFIPGRLITDNIIMSHELVKGYEKKNISPRCMLKIDMQKAYDSV
ncbi:PREDICTED: uncharacterized protein LOC109240616 [Nicotiana attenuata]|uniref:uncharacterized protein LOC109240616 n=1 Tax=Nicotiana attenuata TaxID=49451 RepID=UPI0009058E0F|nr:PREDICTED: uncharacterized protein LOC109240616 [Nicotiana attenuata]